METLKNITKIAFSNIFNLGSSFILGFILPIYISVADYGMYKEYTLYISFVYIFNLGFNDGIYIEYGGKKQNSLDKKDVTSEHSYLYLFQLGMFILMFTYSFFSQDPTLMLFSVAAFFMNIIQYHKNFLQATGEFDLYAKLNMFNTTMNTLTMLFAIYVLQSKNYIIYILMSVISLFLTYLVYEYFHIKNWGFDFFNIKKITKDKLKFLYKIGIVILLSNMMVTFIANIGSWVVNLTYSIEEFGQYSFSTSLLNIILLIVNAISLVFYNIIAAKEDKVFVRLLKKVLLMLGIIGGIAYFAIELIIYTFIEKYIPALDVLSITFMAIPYIMVNNVVFINLYKTRNNKKEYLFDMLKFVGIALVLILAVSLITDDVMFIAMATTASYILWYLITTRMKFTYLKDSKKELLLLATHIVAFYISVHLIGGLVGAMIYLVYFIILLILNKKEVKNIRELIK